MAGARGAEWFPVSRDVREILERWKRIEERPPRFYERFSRFSGRCLGRLTREMKLTEGTLQALERSKLRVKPGDFWAGFLLALCLPLVVFFGGWLVPGLFGAGLLGSWYLPVLGLALSTLGGGIFYLYPFSLAESERSEAQSRAVHTLMMLAFALYHRPDLRGATVFAADVSEGQLAEDLQKGLLELDEKRAHESVRHLLTLLANRWGEIDEGVRTAIFDVLRSTGQHEEAARLQDLAQAPKRALESSELQLGKRLTSLVTPTMAFIVFGSLLIVAAIGLSPVFGMIGLGFIDLKFFALVAAAVVMGFGIFTMYFGGKRPATFPQPAIPEADPRLLPRGKSICFGHPTPTWLPALLVFFAIAWPYFLYLSGFEAGLVGTLAQGINAFWLIWAIMGAIVVYTTLSIGPRAKLREEERRKSSDWEVALNTIGSRVIDGEPMHRAMVETAELMHGSPLAPQLRELTLRTERLSVSTDEALFGGGGVERGLAERIYNPLVRSFLAVITRIRRSSETIAGRACMLAGDFLGTLKRVERGFRERIDEALGNLSLMAAVLIPLVCAMSVWVMELISGVSFAMRGQVAEAGLSYVPFLLGGLEAEQLVWLKLMMGLTTVSLALILARYISTIRAGGDRVEFWSSARWMVFTSTLVFSAAYILFGFIRISGV